MKKYLKTRFMLDLILIIASQANIIYKIYFIDLILLLRFEKLKKMAN
jgi:hypothetical protein